MTRRFALYVAVVAVLVLVYEATRPVPAQPVCALAIAVGLMAAAASTA